MRKRFNQAAALLMLAAVFAALIVDGKIWDGAIFLVVGLAYSAGYIMGGE